MKRVISYLFVAVLFLSVLACGGAKEKEAEATTPETEVVEETIVVEEEQPIVVEEVQVEETEVAE